MKFRHASPILRSSDVVRSKARQKAFTDLYTSDYLAPFYKQCGFKPAFGMTCTLVNDSLLQGLNNSIGNIKIDD